MVDTKDIHGDYIKLNMKKIKYELRCRDPC